MRKFDFEWLDVTLEALKGKPVYLTIDLDVMDPSIFPGTGTPEPGGVSFLDLMRAAVAVVRRTNVVGCDLVELSPARIDLLDRFARTFRLAPGGPGEADLKPTVA